MSFELTEGIVRILKPDGTTAGTGFVVSDAGLIATCAHVVQSAGAGPGDTVRLRFHAADEEREVTVEQRWWSDLDAKDAAILQTEGMLPEGVTSLPLGSSRDSRGHPFRSRGYRLAEHFPGGLEAEGMIQGKIAYGHQDALQLLTSQIDNGMSGAPLWDEKSRRVVGMVNAFWETERHVDAGLALAIPTESLQAVCPALQVSDICPYKGLAAFEEVDAEFFLGREALVKEMVDRLRGNPRFLAVVGPSGSGKSSVVQAGLFPALRRGEVPGSEDWHLLSFRPGADPHAALSTAGLDSYEKGDLQSKRLAIIADQFEDLFALCPEPLQKGFLLRLLALLEEDLPVTVVLVLRADFYGHLLRHQSLVQWLKMGQVNVSPMGPAELKIAVEEPANQIGLHFESGLVVTIINEAGKEEHPLPLLESALTQLWEKRKDGLLTHEAYERVGRVAGAIGQWAEDAYTELDAEDRRLAQRIFTRLVRYGEGKVADTRQQKTLSELATRPEEWEPQHRLVRQLADIRLLVTGGDPGAVTVEIIHDALLQQWSRLKHWIAEQRTFYLWRQRLDERLREWEEKAQDEGALLHGALLVEAERWLKEQPEELNEAEQGFIEHSQSLRKRQQAARDKRRRLILLAAVGVAVVSCVLAFLVLGLWFSARSEANARATAQVQAETARETAEAEADVRATAQAVAEERRRAQERMAAEMQSLALASSARQALDDGNPDLAIALALRANQVEIPPERAQSALTEAAYASHTRQRFVGHEGWVFSVAYDPNGNTVLSGSLDGSVRLWDAETGQEIRRFEEHTAPVRSVTYSPDGSKALTGSEDGSLILWALESGDQIRQYQGHRDWVLSVALGPDGHQGLSGSADNTVILWDIDNGEVIYRLDSIHTDAVWSVAFSPTGDTAASASADGRVCLWSVQNPGGVRCFDAHDARVLNIAFSPRGHTLLTGSADNSLALWRVRDKEVIHRFEGHTNWVYGVAFSPDGQTALSASADNSLVLWDLERLTMIRRLDGHTDEVQAVAFGPNSDLAVSGGRDNSVRLWDLSGGKETPALMGHSGEVLAVAFSPDGKTILSGGGDDDPSLALWNVAEKQVVQKFQGHTAAISSLAFSPDGSRVLSGSHDRSLILWDVATGDQIHSFTGHAGAVRTVAISPDGRSALSGGNTSDHCLVQWNLDSKQEVDRLCGHTNVVTSIAFSPSGATALSGSHDHSLILWDIESGQAIRSFLGHNDWVLKVAFVQDGRTALSASADGTLILWDVATGLAIHHLDGHRNRVWSLAPSPDGRTAVSGSADGSLILWELESGTELRRFYRHDGWVWSVTFSPDASTVASGSADKSVRLWRLWPPAPTELSDWLHANRYVRELTCDEKVLYRVEPLCSEQ